MILCCSSLHNIHTIPVYLLTGDNNLLHRKILQYLYVIVAKNLNANIQSKLCLSFKLQEHVWYMPAGENKLKYFHIKACRNEIFWWIWEIKTVKDSFRQHCQHQVNRYSAKRKQQSFCVFSQTHVKLKHIEASHCGRKLFSLIMHWKIMTATGRKHVT